jgi:hypothetical protein
VKPALGKTIRGKKHDNVWKNHLKGLGVFTNPHLAFFLTLSGIKLTTVLGKFLKSRGPHLAGGD